MRKFIFILIFLSVSGISRAEIIEPKESSSLAPSVKIVSEGYDLDANLFSEIEEGVTFLLNLYSRRFNFTYPSNFVVSIRIFDEFKDFINYRKKYAPNLIASYAFYLPELNEAVVWKSENPGELVQSIYHEISHLLINNYMYQCPKWFNEGLSLYFEGLNVSGDKIFVAPTYSYDDQCRELLDSLTIMDIEVYLAYTPAKWDENYAVNSRLISFCWSMMSFLMSNSQRQEIVKAILEYSKEHGSEQAVLVFAINKYYPGALKQFESDWRKWAKEAPKYYRYSREGELLGEFTKE